MIVLKNDKKQSYFNEMNLFIFEHCKKTSKMDTIVNILHIIVYYFH